MTMGGKAAPYKIKTKGGGIIFPQPTKIHLATIYQPLFVTSWTETTYWVISGC